MKEETLKVERWHKGLLALGIILILIRLGITFYRESNVIFDIEEYHRTYPYAYIGMILFLAGILSLMIGVLYSFGKAKRDAIIRKDWRKPFDFYLLNSAVLGARSDFDFIGIP